MNMFICRSKNILAIFRSLSSGDMSGFRHSFRNSAKCPLTTFGKEKPPPVALKKNWKSSWRNPPSIIFNRDQSDFFTSSETKWWQHNLSRRCIRWHLMGVTTSWWAVGHRNTWVLFFGLLFVRKCCTVPIKLPSLQRPRCCLRRSQACNIFLFLSQMSRVWSHSLILPKGRWFVPDWNGRISGRICEISDLKFQHLVPCEFCFFVFYALTEQHYLFAFSVEPLKERPFSCSLLTLR